MEQSEKEDWYWMDVLIDKTLIGEVIEKGEGAWKKKYIYIKIPSEAGYNDYCFLLPLSLFHDSYFSICADMKIELIKDPAYRESGKKYKRYHYTGKELYNSIFDEYEDNFVKECKEREKKERINREKRERKINGNIIYGRYTGNNYGSEADQYYDFYFSHDEVCTNNKSHQKVSVYNIEKKFTVIENVSKHFFRETQAIIQERFADWLITMEQIQRLESIEQALKKVNYNNSAFQEIRIQLHDKCEEIKNQVLNDLKHYM